MPLVITVFPDLILLDLPVSRRLFVFRLLLTRLGLLVAAEEDAGYVLVGLELFDEPRNHRLWRNQDVGSDQTGISSLRCENFLPIHLHDVQGDPSG